jgi:UDP-glucose 4-epimerase
MKLINNKIVVTGGAGFIGSHIVDQLVEKGAIVTVIDNLVTGNINNLEKSKSQIKFENIDILDDVKVRKVLKRQDVVFHLAANADVPYSVNHPDYDFKVNIDGSFNILKACLDYKIQKVIFASSAAIYGNPIYTPIDENHPTNPVSPYGASKLAIEHLGRSYFHTYGLPFVTMRIFNTYGERQPRYVMYDLLKKLYKNNKELEVLGTGDQLRDYSYVTDTASAFILAAEKANGGDIYNIAGGKVTSIKQVVQYILKALNINKIEINYTNKSWAGDITVLSANINKIQNKLGFVPQIKLSDGIRKLHNSLSSKIIEV